MEEQAGNSIPRINHQPTLNDNNHLMDSMASNAIFFNLISNLQTKKEKMRENPFTSHDRTNDYCSSSPPNQANKNKSHRNIDLGNQ